MKPFKLNIQLLSLALLAFAMVGTWLGTAVSSMLVSKKNLEQNYLIENQYYAQKLALTTDSLFRNMFKSLKMESQDGEYLTKDSNAIYQELKHTLDSTTFFNSMLFVNQKGYVLASAPDMSIKGKQLSTVGAKAALKHKVSLVSKPYVGVTGNLILLISVPVFDDHGGYKGFLAGTIHLHEENSLTRVLDKHPKHKNDSYVFVVDSDGNVIYHPEDERINTNAKENKAVQKALKGDNGNQEVINTRGVPMLAGYASSTSKWGIISQTPKHSVMEPTLEMAKQVSQIAIPFMIFVFLISIVMLKTIIKPVRDLAEYARNISENETVPVPRISGWYYELKELKRAILLAVDSYQRQLHYVENESNLDPLTGHFNRRSLEKTIEEMESYSILLFDLDRFKAVNDQYGHQMGDEVLKYIAKLAKEETREKDLCFRLGGEEFLIILPETDTEMAETIAERIRKKAEMTSSPTGNPVTLSIGIGSSAKTAKHFTDLLNITDQALYKAKQEGRNKIVIAAKM
ncbi:sensor domain-containing diguanylate cyclase [Peribacillus glennii]|uniref:Diguanylate cyclase n=1 Tax=Peribacillus glennii TaxID=2303991 RepID=A0A372L7K4_9BACI|nr:sensor domain-containing diguanylate cyclase [Peribacillus glennii]RFU61220.1 diguanylate cyclase [Peribacillus glennii]